MMCESTVISCTSPLTYAIYVCDKCGYEILFHGVRSTDMPNLHWLTISGNEFSEFEIGKSYTVCGKYKYLRQSDTMVESLTNMHVDGFSKLDE